MTFNIEDKSEE